MGLTEGNGGEHGFLLLTSHLGNPERKPLTVPQFRELMQRVQQLPCRDGQREICAQDLIRLGYGAKMAEHIARLLGEEDLLAWYLHQARRQGIQPLTRATKGYPLTVRKRLGADSPGVLWARGDIGMLEGPMVSLVGSRELGEPNRAFAREVGRQAARQGLTLVSGNARGADKTAQNACLQAGGRVISVVADSLLGHDPGKNVLYLSESSFDEGFSAQRALSRNRVIHAMGYVTFVAQSELGKGGTWDGTTKNLRFGWSPVLCFRDGSESAARLEQMGAYLIGLEELGDFGILQEQQELTFF